MLLALFIVLAVPTSAELPKFAFADFFICITIWAGILAAAAAALDVENPVIEVAGFVNVIVTTCVELPFVIFIASLAVSEDTVFVTDETEVPVEVAILDKASDVNPVSLSKSFVPDFVNISNPWITPVPFANTFNGICEDVESPPACSTVPSVVVGVTALSVFVPVEKSIPSPLRKFDLNDKSSAAVNEVPPDTILDVSLPVVSKPVVTLDWKLLTPVIPSTVGATAVVPS